MRKIKVGIVGCGMISETYFNASKKFRMLEVVACSDIIPERSKAKFEKHGVPNMTNDELFAIPDIDIVLNLTPPQVHSKIAMDTLNAGKTLTSDKQLYWTSTAPATVTAWYPTNETVDLSDQSEGLAYMLKAEVPDATYDNVIALGFKHQLAKVRVVLSGTQAALAQSVEVYGYTTCTNNEGAPVTDNAQQGWLKMKKQTYGNTECWEANVVPGDITPTNFIRINGQTATINENFPATLASGNMYTIDLTVGDKQIFGGETITKPGEYIVKGTVTESITLDSEGVTLILEEADINTNGIAINIVSGNPTLKIQGTENAVKSTTSTAIHVGSGCTLTIEGVNGITDKLKAEGGKNDGTATTGAGNAGAGIGSSNGGNIVIHIFSFYWFPIRRKRSHRFICTGLLWRHHH